LENGNDEDSYDPLLAIHNITMNDNIVTKLLNHIQKLSYNLSKLYKLLNVTGITRLYNVLMLKGSWLHDQFVNYIPERLLDSMPQLKHLELVCWDDENDMPVKKRHYFRKLSTFPRSLEFIAIDACIAIYNIAECNLLKKLIIKSGILADALPSNLEHLELHRSIIDSRNLGFNHYAVFDKCTKLKILHLDSTNVSGIVCGEVWKNIFSKTLHTFIDINSNTQECLHLHYLKSLKHIKVSSSSEYVRPTYILPHVIQLQTLHLQNVYVPNMNETSLTELYTEVEIQINWCHIGNTYVSHYTNT